jgi:hypothetical protein
MWEKLRVRFPGLLRHVIEWTHTDFFFNWYSGGWSPIGSTRHCGHQWPIVPAPGDYDNGEIGGMIDRGNRSTRRKPAPMSLCPPQTPHAARTRTRAVAVGSQRLTAWATARPHTDVYEAETFYQTPCHTSLKLHKRKIRCLLATRFDTNDISHFR